jgi:hypothetical protein
VGKDISKRKPEPYDNPNWDGEEPPKRKARRGEAYDKREKQKKKKTIKNSKRSCQENGGNDSIRNGKLLISVPWNKNGNAGNREEGIENKDVKITRCKRNDRRCPFLNKNLWVEQRKKEEPKARKNTRSEKGTKGDTKRNPSEG